MKGSFITLSILLPVLLSAQQTADSLAIGQRIDQLYQAITFADTSQTHFDELRACFADHAQFIAHNGTDYRRLDREAFIANFERMIAAGQIHSFEEYETARTVQIDGAIAQVWSRYATVLNGKPLAGGVNSIQLLRAGDDWVVTSIIWSSVPAAGN